MDTKLTATLLVDSICASVLIAVLYFLYRSITTVRGMITADTDETMPVPATPEPPVSTHSGVVSLSDDTFDQQIQSHKLAIVDFWGEHCGPCKRMEPMLEVIAKRHPHVLVAKADTGKAYKSASRYGIRMIPTILFFRDGLLRSGMPGSRPQDEFDKRVDAFVQENSDG